MLKFLIIKRDKLGECPDSEGRRDEFLGFRGSASASLNIAPYYESNQKYVNSNTFQIISAGLDGQFGGGGQWTSVAAEDSLTATKDNQANFHPYKLGVPGN